KKINNDSKKYYEFNENILEVSMGILPLNFMQLFDNGNKILKFEIGFGNGDSLIKLAQKNPNINYFGIDRKMDRIRTTLSKLNHSDKIPNLIISRFGTDYLLEMIPEGSFDEIIMNFPDPWPKKKHHKNRTVSEDFLTVLHKLLKDDGIFRLSSDHNEYSFEVIDVFNRSNLFKNLYHPAHYRTEVSNRVETQFEKHKKREGFTIHHMKYLKV
ncbi:MAG: tRNA (guanosine(46)-N7)-methyltransferase TrmB, partial [Candidatus Delongbacteria bacterium]|nr:tRNA (guanosine(46)-N7)-methyltransferase TrmB [Candidatus Delongbacteria bacterium]